MQRIELIKSKDENMKLAKTTLLVVGLLGVLVGLIWMGQGSGYFPYPAQSFMINQSPWILRGAMVAVVGAVITWASRRM